MQKLIVFLGNPGPEFKNTRHNVGWLFADHLGLEDWQERYHSLYTRRDGSIFQKPQTFMNLSGRAVQEIASFYKIAAKDILVVHDDLEADFGHVEMRLGGGLAGHNGLRSVKQMLGTDGFMRLRMGIGRPDRQEVASYVTSRFSSEQEKGLPDMFKKAEVLLHTFTAGD